MRYVALSEVLALHRAVSLNHPFVDGNKRVAHAAMRTEFEAMLLQALAIDPAQDPDNRLVTLIMQKRARLFLAHTDDLFLED
jgi:prophage maintenance system killer protein